MERALLVLAVFSLLILSSVEATTNPPQSDVVAMINNNLNKMKSEAQLALATFDRLAQDVKSEDQVRWVKECREAYQDVIKQSSEPIQTHLAGHFDILHITLDGILSQIEICDILKKDLAGGLENPAKIYENSIRDLTLQAISLKEGVAGPRLRYDIDDSISPSPQ